MNREIYIRQFSRLIHWYLPEHEAEDVISDYKEFFVQDAPDREEELAHKLGSPLHAVQALAEPKEYRRWLAVFSILLLCLLLPEIMLLMPSLLTASSIPSFLLLLCPMVLAMFFFRPGRTRPKADRPAFPRKLAAALLSLLLMSFVFCAALAGMAMGGCSFLSPADYGTLSRWILCLWGSAAAILGTAGLIQARVSSYRWRSLYILSLTVLAEALFLTQILCNLSLDASFFENMWPSYAFSISFTGIAGLAGTGAGLC